ncbi:MAG: hypothetical protein MRY81_16885 [Donghicola eburneus]|nr:hypothetical protein [Donghicola eburneus]MCI5041345.1 hypothetical protein [Donghicola eburneus]
MQSLIQGIDRVTFQLMAVAFVGIHVPLTVLVVYGIIVGFQGLVTVLLLALAATLVSTLVSLVFVYRIRADRDDVAHSLG